MNTYSDTLRDHCCRPRNREPLEGPDAVGMASLHGHSPYVVVYLYAKDNLILDARFQATGCGVAIACGSMLTQLIKGRSWDACSQLATSDLADALDGIPPDKLFCAELAIQALRLALEQLRGRSTGEPV